jgi:hypothetical protein
VELTCERTSYITLKGCWCDTVTNVVAPTKDKTGDMKGSFPEELESLLDQFPKYCKENFVTRIQCRSRERTYFQI